MKHYMIAMLVLVGCGAQQRMLDDAAADATMAADGGSVPGDAGIDAASPLDANVPDAVLPPAPCATACAAVCDRVLSTCVAAPNMLCGACENDAQCNVWTWSSMRYCVSIPTSTTNATVGDRACLVACAVDADCVRTAAPSMICMAFSGGSWCVPDPVLHRLHRGPWCWTEQDDGGMHRWNNGDVP